MAVQQDGTRGQKIAGYEAGKDRKFYKKQRGGNVDIYGLPV